MPDNTDDTLDDFYNPPFPAEGGWPLGYAYPDQPGATNLLSCLLRITPGSTLVTSGTTGQYVVHLKGKAGLSQDEPLILSALYPNGFRLIVNGFRLDEEIQVHELSPLQPEQTLRVQLSIDSGLGRDVPPAFFSIRISQHVLGSIDNDVNADVWLRFVNPGPHFHDFTIASNAM